MNKVNHANDDNLFPVRKPQNPASLTQEEVAEIMHLADVHGLTRGATAKLLLAYRNRKKAAYAKQKKK